MNNVQDEEPVFVEKNSVYYDNVGKLFKVVDFDDEPTIEILRDFDKKPIVPFDFKRILNKVAYCSNCGFCVTECPTGAISFDNDIVKIDEMSCVHCERCLRFNDYGCYITEARTSTKKYGG